MSALNEAAVRLPVAPLALPLPFVLPPNLLFVLVVVAHAFRRMLPPY